MLKNKVILIGNLTNYNLLLIELGINLRLKDYQVKLIDISALKEFNFETGEVQSLIDTPIKGLIRYKFIGLIIRKIYVIKIFKEFSPNDIVNVHFVSHKYLRLAKLCKKLDLKLVSTIWGSDLIKVKKENLPKLGMYFNYSDRITMVSGLISEFNKSFSTLNLKVDKTLFGLSRIELESDNLIENRLRSEFKINKRIVVTIGNNGIPEQQHLKVLSAIAKLPNELLDDLFLIFPMTYGRNEEIISEIISYCDKIKVSFAIIERFLSDKEMIAIQTITEILIFFQTTDAFSAFLTESIYRGSITIVGEWLPYNSLNEWGIFYYKSNFNNLANDLEFALEDWSENKKYSNAKTIKNHLQWKNVINLWEESYKKAYSLGNEK